MKIALVTDGTWGDILPFTTLAQALIHAGHSVTLYTNEFYKEYANHNALPFQSITTSALRSEFLSHKELWHPTKGVRVIGKASQEIFTQSFDTLYTALADADLIMSYTFTFAAHTIAELYGIPCITLCISPIQIRTLNRLPIFFKGKNYNFLPSFLKKFFYFIGDTYFIDPHFKKSINAKRQSLGLSPIKHFVHWSTMNFPSIGLWPEWYAPTYADQPLLHTTHFPASVEFETSINQSLHSWIGQGTQPILVTMGSGYAFYEHLISELLTIASPTHRFIIIAAGHTESISSTSHISIVPQLSLSHVIPLCSIFIHHGGAGTIAQSIHGGIPQLIIPMSHDQPDNAARIHEHGLGEILWDIQPKAKDILAYIKKIIAHPTIKEACKNAQEKCLTQKPAFEEVVKIIEGITR